MSTLILWRPQAGRRYPQIGNRTTTVLVQQSVGTTGAPGPPGGDTFVAAWGTQAPILRRGLTRSVMSGMVPSPKQV